MMETASLKSCLENWRELVLHADAVLGWEKDWYPAVIAGLLTFKFFLVWYCDPTLLSLIAICGLFITLADYIGPKIMAQIFKPDSWTGAKEKKFDDICSSVVSASRCVEDAFHFCREAKEKKPIVHFLGTVFALFALAYIGGRVNNFFLLYLVSLAVAMLPGMHRKGLLKKYFSQVTLKITEAVKGKDHLKKAE